MNKFFYRIILLIPLFFSQISFSLSFKYNAGENLVERIREKYSGKTYKISTGFY